MTALLLMLALWQAPAGSLDRVAGTDTPFFVRVLWSESSTWIEVQFEGARVIEIAIINPSEDWAYVISADEVNIRSGMSIDTYQVSSGDELTLYFLSDERLSAVVRGVRPPF